MPDCIRSNLTATQKKNCTLNIILQFAVLVMRRKNYFFCRLVILYLYVIGSDFFLPSLCSWFVCLLIAVIHSIEFYFEGDTKPVPL